MISTYLCCRISSEISSNDTSRSDFSHSFFCSSHRHCIRIQVRRMSIQCQSKNMFGSIPIQRPSVTRYCIQLPDHSSATAVATPLPSNSLRCNPRNPTLTDWFFVSGNYVSRRRQIRPQAVHSERSHSSESNRSVLTKTYSSVLEELLQMTFTTTPRSGNITMSSAD